MRQSSLVTFWVIILLLSHVNPGQSQEAPLLPKTVQSTPARQKQILLLNTYQIGLPIPDSIDRGILTSLKNSGYSVNDILIEHLDLSRDPGREHRAAEVDLLRQTLANKNIGIVIAEGTPALNFLTAEVRGLVPDAALISLTIPKIHSLVDDSYKTVIDIPWRVDPAGTLKAALDLFPETRRVLVVTGANDGILPFLEDAKKAFAPWQNKLDFEYTNEMTYEQMMHRISTLPPDSIIIYSPYFIDTSGRSFVPAEVVVKVCRLANAPVFATLKEFLGHGIVGGKLLSTDMMGQQAGRIALDYLSGRLRPDKQITTFTPTTQKMFDWHELSRWKANTSALSGDSIIINRPVTLWGQYRKEVITAAVFFMVLIAWILTLSILNRRLKRLTAAAGESEARFRVMIEHAPEAIIVYNLDSKRIITANPNAARLFGCTIETLLQQTPEQFYEPGQPEEESIAETMADHHMHAMAGKEVIFERAIRTCDKRIVECEIRIVQLPLLGQQLMRASFIDITGRKHAEKERSILQSRLNQAQKMEAIGVLAGGIAHDFNNILGVIIGYAELTRADMPPGSLHAEDLDHVLSSAYRARDLVKQILAFSRSSKVDRIPLKIQPLVKETLKMLRASLPSTISIEENIRPQDGVILADPTQVHQVIMNLCTNAFHAMEKDGGLLSVGVNKKTIGAGLQPDAEHIPPGEYVELTVSDTGRGIMPDVRDKIFDPFFTTKEVGKGTGMGLSITHGIIKDYGGAITVESTPGRGTTFHAYFPLEHEKLTLPETPREAPRGREHILLIDDEKMLAEMTRTMLERLGYTVTARYSSIEALETFVETPDRFDLVITDQTMPGITGIDLARRMLQIRRDLPVILCTGFSNQVNDESARAIGIREFAVKPLTMSSIGQLIRKAIG